MTRKLDRLNPSNSTGVAFTRLWQRNCETVEANFDDQQSQLTTINNIIDPNTLTPDKKPVWIFMESYLTGEQADLDAKATTYGITTEKTNYDNAISALTTYLATLTTAVAWNDTSGNTTIVDATFRGKFTDVLTTKQTLINAIAAQAKTLADAAQSTANTANTTATTAKNNDAISSSWTSPGTILSATDAGSSATITIANHTRKYGDSSSASVTGGTITGQSYSTKYLVYYDDSNHSGGAVTYHATTNPNTALPNAATGRHYCGELTTPAAGGAATSGGVSPPGSGGQLSGTDIP